MEIIITFCLLFDSRACVVEKMRLPGEPLSAITCQMVGTIEGANYLKNKPNYKLERIKCARLTEHG